MHEFMQGWFSSVGFMPHGHCYLWTPSLLWTYVSADVLITLSYFSIPLGILYFVRKRTDLQSHSIFILFSAFIFACGTTHLIAVWTIWHPDYWLDAGVKAATAAISLVTAISLWWQIPKALALPSARHLQEAVVRLENEVGQRKAAEAELLRLREASDYRFQHIFEQAAVGVTEVDMASGQLIRANRKYCDIVGYSQEELRLLDFQSVTHPDDLPAELDNKQALKSGRLREITMERRYLHKNSDLIWVSLTISPLWEAGEPPSTYLAIVQDISERKAAELALKESEAMMSVILENVSAYIYLKDLEGRYLYANRKVCDLWGMTEDDVIGHGDEKFFDAQTAAQIRKNDRSVLVDGKTIRCEETDTVTKTGKTATYWTVKLPLRHQDGSIYALCGISTDISERKQAEEKILENEKRLNEAQRIAHLGSWNWEIATGKITWSDETYRVYGVSPDTFVLDAASFFGLIHADDRPAMQAWVDDCLAEKRPGELVFRTILPDGTVRFISGKGELVYDARGNPLHMAGTAQDITERKQAETALRESEERLRLVLDGMGPQMFVGLMDTEGVVLVANQPALEVAGLGLEDVVGKPVQETYWWAYSDDVRQRLHAAVQRAAHGEAVRYDEQIRIAESRFIWIDFNVQPLHDKSGEIVFLVPSAVVITERKRAEEALEAQLDELRRWHNATLGRETRVRELKQEVNILLARAGEPPRYASVAADDDWIGNI